MSNAHSNPNQESDVKATGTDTSERAQLIRMVHQVQNASACVMDFDGMMNRLEKKIGYTEIGSLIFDPPEGKVMTAEEIVDLAIRLRSQQA